MPDHTFIEVKKYKTVEQKSGMVTTLAMKLILTLWRFKVFSSLYISPNM